MIFKQKGVFFSSFYFFFNLSIDTTLSLWGHSSVDYVQMVCLSSFAHCMVMYFGLLSIHDLMMNF